MNIIVSTTHRVAYSDPRLAEFLAESGFPFYPRERLSLEKLARQHQAHAVIIWQDEGPVLYHEGQKFFFHPSVARVRLGAYRKLGTIDPLVKACRLEPGYSYLDCTMGLGADIIVAAYFLSAGRILGLESAPAIAQVVKWGMKLYQPESQWLKEAIDRVEVINAEHKSFLRSLPSGSFDIVYFDPMFRQPLWKSSAISPLRALANHEPLSGEAVAEACRVARRRVVIKERKDSPEFKRLGVNDFVGSPHNMLTYGYIEVGPGKRE